MAPPVIIDLHRGVFRITLNRPEVRNALDDSLIESLRQAVERAAGEKEVFAVLLAGAGPTFCAGAHIGWMREQGAAGPEENLRSAERLARLFLELDRLPQPLVGRIHGGALGGGVGLTSICDVAVASATATFALSEARLGLTPSVIAPYILRKLGRARATELVLTGRRFNGEEAASLGLVCRAVDDALLDAAVDGVLSGIRLGGPQALAGTKALFRELDARPRWGEEAARWTAQELATARAGEEARAGLAAFLEKRPPPWAPGAGREA